MPGRAAVVGNYRRVDGGLRHEVQRSRVSEPGFANESNKTARNRGSRPVTGRLCRQRDSGSAGCTYA